MISKSTNGRFRANAVLRTEQKQTTKLFIPYILMSVNEIWQILRFRRCYQSREIPSLSAVNSRNSRGVVLIAALYCHALHDYRHYANRITISISSRCKMEHIYSIFNISLVTCQQNWPIISDCWSESTGADNGDATFEVKEKPLLRTW